MRKRNRKMGSSLALQAAAPKLDRLAFTADCEPFEIEAAEGADGVGKKLRKFSTLAYTGGAMNVSGFYRPVVVELSGLKVPNPNRPILLNHDIERIIGHSTEVDVSQQRIKLSGLLSGVGEDAMSVAAMADNGFPWQASIGCSVQKTEFIDAGATVKVNGKNFNGPLVVVRAATLGEVSFVAIGADMNTSAMVATHSEELGTMFEQWLTAKGFDVAALSDATKTSLKAMFDAEQKPAIPPSAPAVTPPATASFGSGTASRGIAEITAAATAEGERQNRIMAMVQEAQDATPRNLALVARLGQIGQMACDQGWTDQRVELEMLRARGGAAPVTFSTRGTEVNNDVLEAAVCMAAKLPNIDKQFDEKTLTAASRQWKNGMGLQELVLRCANANGYGGHYSFGSNPMPALKAAFRTDGEERGIRAGGAVPSTYDLSALLTNVANKFLIFAFDFVESSWREISKISSVRDFKAMTSYSLTGDMTYEKLPPGGEIKHGTMGKETYTNQADTYAKMLGIDRRDLINDDLGAFQRVGQRLGRGGALKLNDAFWAEFLDNTAFFTAGRGNFDDGADTVFDATGLARADVFFSDMTDPDGKPLGAQPRILLVPPGHRIPALRLMNSQQVLTASDIGASNPWAGAFKVVSSTYMNNSSITGYSALKWYLLADPNDIPVIEVCFLNGVERPTVESADLDFSLLGVAYRGYFDFGVNLQEYRGGVAMKGEA